MYIYILEIIETFINNIVTKLIGRKKEDIEYIKYIEYLEKIKNKINIEDIENKEDKRKRKEKKLIFLLVYNIS